MRDGSSWTAHAANQTCSIASGAGGLPAKTQTLIIAGGAAAIIAIITAALYIIGMLV